MKCAVVGVLCALFFVLTDLAQGSPGIPKEYCHTVFTKQDTDKDGKLSDGEVKAAVKILVDRCNDSNLDKLMNAVHKTSDGKTDFDEFFQLIWIITEGRGYVDWELKSKFGMFDEDGDGYLSAKEIKKALPKLGLGPFALDEVEFLMSSLWDKNRDGKLSFFEFDRVVDDLRSVRRTEKSI